METIKLVNHSQAAVLSPVKRELLEGRLKRVLKPAGSSAPAILPRYLASPARIFMEPGVQVLAREVESALSNAAITKV